MLRLRTVLFALAALTATASCESNGTDASGGAGGSAGSSGGPTSTCASLFSGSCDAPGLVCPWADTFCQGTYTCNGYIWTQTTTDCSPPDPPPQDCAAGPALDASWVIVPEGPAAITSVVQDGNDLVVASIVSAGTSIEGQVLATEQAMVLARHDGATGALVGYDTYDGAASPQQLMRGGATWTVSGWMIGAATFGGATLQPTGDYGLFVVTLDDALQPLWGLSYGGPSNDSGSYAAQRSDGSIVIASAQESGASVAGLPWGNNGMADVAVAAIDSAGAGLWANSFGSIENDRPQGVGVDSNNNVFVAGWAAKEINFGGSNLPADHSMYVTKHDMNGAHLWSLTCSKQTEATDIAVDAAGDVYVAGFFNDGTLDCGGGAIIGAKGQQFAMKLAGSDGAILWTTLFDGEGYNSTVATPHIAWDATHGLLVSTRESVDNRYMIFANVMNDANGNVVRRSAFSAFGKPLVWDVGFTHAGNPILAGHVEGVICGTGASGLVDGHHAYAIALAKD